MRKFNQPISDSSQTLGWYISSNYPNGHKIHQSLDPYDDLWRRIVEIIKCH
jgi:hypothetical protein